MVEWWFDVLHLFFAECEGESCRILQQIPIDPTRLANLHQFLWHRQQIPWQFPFKNLYILYHITYKYMWYACLYTFYFHWDIFTRPVSDTESIVPLPGAWRRSNPHSGVKPGHKKSRNVLGWPRKVLGKVVRKAGACLDVWWFVVGMILGNYVETKLTIDKYSVTKRLERQCLYGNSFLYKVIMYWQVEQQLQQHWGLGDVETATTSHWWRVTAYDIRAP